MIMLSVICPTYNQGKYLRQGLDSIFNQVVDFNYEVLVGEDCSPDNTNDILSEYEKKYSDKIRVFHRENNLRQSRNIYDLFMRATGKYIITLDLDDYWTDNKKLQKQVDFLETHDEYIGVAHNFLVVDKEGNPSSIRTVGIEERFLNRDFTLHDFEIEGFVYQTGTFMYHNVWKENDDYSILYTSDDTVVDLTINALLLLRKNIFIMKETMSAYRLVISMEETATNARSIGQKNLAEDFYKTSRQLKMLHQYFERKVDYSVMWSNIILSYLKNMAKKNDNRYSVKVWCSMFVKSSMATKQKVIKYLSGSLRRKICRVKSV